MRMMNEQYGVIFARIHSIYFGKFSTSGKTEMCAENEIEIFLLTKPSQQANGCIILVGKSRRYPKQCNYTALKNSSARYSMSHTQSDSMALTQLDRKTSLCLYLYGYESLAFWTGKGRYSQQ